LLRQQRPVFFLLSNQDSGSACQTEYPGQNHPFRFHASPLSNSGYTAKDRDASVVRRCTVNPNAF
jgi:hypothetical protein